MRNLNEYTAICMEMLDEMGIPYGNVTKVTVNTRAKKRWGQTEYNKSTGNYSININSQLLDERNSEDGLVNTLLHELLHTCPGCMNHGALWKKYAAQVKDYLGYDIKRTGSAEEEGVVTMAEQSHNYIVKCEKCGKEFYYERAGKVVKYCYRYHCKCGGGLTLINNTNNQFLRAACYK